MPSYRRGFAALGIVLVGACGGATASRGVDADGGAPPNDPNAVCVVRGDDCVGRDDCCPPITAALIDVQHACVSRRDAPIKCPPPVPGCQRSGMPLATCFMEDTDSGDAKVYYSSNYFVGGLGYKGCTPEISEVVNRAEPSCPP